MSRPPIISECTCNAKGAKPTRLVFADGTAVGVVGMKEVFERFYAEGRKPSPEVAAELLKSIKIYNYVPSSAEKKYQAALLREYTTYCATHD